MNKPKIIQHKLKFLSKPTLLVLLLGGSVVGDVYAADSNKVFNFSVAGQETVQQNITITGKVTSAEDKLGIPGVNVNVKGGTAGVSTDIDGNYSISVSSTDAVLVFTGIGFKTQEIRVGSQKAINVIMGADVAALNEVVVVGYGTQKKATLTGSISQVRGDEVLKGKATNNIAVALQGEIPGLVITRTSSRPGNEGIDISLRGGISVNATAPMILIDGVEAYAWELSQINADDVDTVSVLKDGAAAIYGTRAGGGVILITTKRGKSGKTKVSYSGSSHVNMLGNRFPVADGKTWGKMFIDAVTTDAFALGSNNPQYNWWIWGENVYRSMAAGERIEGVYNGLWRVLDPNVDQFDAVYGDTWGKDHNLSFSGGNENLKVYTALGYSDDRSLVDVVYDGQKKYNFRTNLDYKVNDWIKTDFNISYDKRILSTPINGVGQGVQDFYIFPLYNTYGQFYDTFGNNNLLAKLTEGGRRNNTDNILRLGGKLTLDLGKITKGLTVTGSANMRQLNTLLIERNNKITMYDWSGETTNPTGLPDYTLGTGSIKSQTAALNTNVRNTNINGFYQVYNAILGYNSGFSGHNIGLTAGITSEKYLEQKFVGFRKNLSNNELDDINLGDATTAEATGGSYENGLVSYLGRLNYDYKGIYLLEGIFRRDGSSKFTPENRWSNFGGVSAGVRLSELQSVKNLNIFDNLKIRTSYGETGSQTGIGNYDYIAGVSMGTTVFGYTGALTNTSSVNSITTTQRTWERVASTNLAVDFALLNNRLSGTFEIYERENKGMLIPVVYPQTLGGSAPRTNSGNFTAKGWEVELNWKDRINDNFSYRIAATLTDSRTKVTSYAGATAINRGLNSQVYSGTGAIPNYIEGQPLNALYVYKTDGYLQNTTEVADYYTAITRTTGGEHPVQGTTNQLIPGSVRKVDLNNDGKITTDDLYYYGDANPHYLFGLTLGLNYKNFDFKMFIQGVGQQYNLREGHLSSPFNALFTNQNATFYGQTWSTENPNARYPVMSQNGARNNWNYKWANDININNNWYARAKSIVLGYTLPKTLLKRILIDNLRVYVSGDNLFEISNVKDGFDPESKSATSQGNVDIYSRTLSFGIDLSL